VAARRRDAVDASPLPQVAPVELLQWPAERDQRAVLQRHGVPCLLLVAPDAAPPDRVATSEDWVRLPADARDIRARGQRLCRRLADRAAADAAVEADGRLTRNGTSIVLTRSEAALLAPLLERSGSTVERAALESAVWPGGAPSHRALDALIYRLRRRLAGSGLSISTSPGHGFAVDVGPVAPQVEIDPRREASR
jgi:two-component system response regulator TctD